MRENHYNEVSVSNLSRELEDLVSSELFNWGAEGVSEELSFIQEKYDPEIIETNTLTLMAYFSQDVPAELKERIRHLAPEATYQCHQKENKDWREEWKRGLKPFELTAPYWIVPSWCEPLADKSLVSLQMDPGMAFGTGTHDTTQICSQLLASLVKTQSVSSAFDIGAGTGVLSLLLRHLQVERITCCDIDPACEQIIKDNFEQNHLTPPDWVTDISSYKGEPLDLMVANIIDGVLVNLKPEFESLFHSKSFLVVSGVLLERKEEFLSEFLKEAPWEVVQSAQQGEWCGFVLRAKQT